MKLLATGLFVLATGCAVDGASPSPSGPASAPNTPAVAPRIEMRLTDAPGDFESVWVNISKVEIESADAGWLTVTESPQKLDLLTLQNDVTAALGGATLEPGMYGQLRMIVDSASVVVGGVESSLDIASGAQTGIKIPLDQMFEENMTYAVTLDYDAAQRVKLTGHGSLMTPVIRVKDFVGTPVEQPPAPSPDPASDPAQ